MFTCFIHSWYSLTDQCPQCSRTGGSSDSTEFIVNPTPEGVTAEVMTAQQAYDKTTELLKAYESGDLHGGKPMQFIEQYASLVSASKDEEIARLKEDVKELVEGLGRCESWISACNENAGILSTIKPLIQKHKL